MYLIVQLGTLSGYSIQVKIRLKCLFFYQSPFHSLNGVIRVIELPPSRLDLGGRTL